MDDGKTREENQSQTSQPLRICRSHCRWNPIISYVDVHHSYILAQPPQVLQQDKTKSVPRAQDVQRVSNCSSVYILGGIHQLYNV